MDWKEEDIVFSDQFSVFRFLYFDRLSTGCGGIITDGKWKIDHGE